MLNLITLNVIILSMILNFQCKDTEALFHGARVARFANIEKAAMRKLALLSAAGTLDFLRLPPGNMLEALKRERQGQHSIRINGQWRLCFVWTDSGATGVEIVDYH
jgi:proteic killer suppression protein